MRPTMEKNECRVLCLNLSFYIGRKSIGKIFKIVCCTNLFTLPNFCQDAFSSLLYCVLLNY